MVPEIGIAAKRKETRHGRWSALPKTHYFLKWRLHSNRKRFPPKKIKFNLFNIILERRKPHDVKEKKFFKPAIRPKVYLKLSPGHVSLLGY